MALKLTATPDSDVVAVVTNLTVFIDTSLDTHLAMVVSELDTASDLKRKIEKEHTSCFTNVGQIVVHAIKVKRLGQLYHLPDSMLVIDALDRAKKTWFLSVDASVVKKYHEEQLVQNPESNNQLTCYGFISNTLADVSFVPEQETPVAHINCRSDASKHKTVEQDNILVAEASQSGEVANRKRKFEHLQETNVDSCKETNKPEIVSQKLFGSTKSDVAKQGSFEPHNKLVEEELQSDQIAKRRKMGHLQEKNIYSGKETSKPEFVSKELYLTTKSDASKNEILEQSNLLVEEASQFDQAARRKDKIGHSQKENIDSVKEIRKLEVVSQHPLEDKNKYENATLDGLTAKPTDDVRAVSNDSRKKKKKGKKSTSKLNQVVSEVPSLMNNVLGEHYDIAAEVDHKKLGEEPGIASATLQDERAITLLEVSTKEKQSDIIPGADDVNVVSNEKNTNENASLDDLTAKPTDDVHAVSNDTGKKKKKGKKSKSKLNQIVSGVPSLGNDVLGEHYGITAEVDHKNLGEEPSTASAPLQGECVITPPEVCPKEKQSDIIPGADEIHVVSNDKNKNENASVDGLTAKTTDDVHVVSNETGKKKKKGKKSKSKLNRVVSGVTSSGNDVLGEHYDITAEVDHKNLGEEPGTASAPLQGITPPVISTKEKQFYIVPGAEKHAIPVLDVENKSKASVEEAIGAADKMRNSKSRCPADAKGNTSLAVGEPFDQQMDVRESGHKNSALSWDGGAAEENTASKKSTVRSNKPNSHIQDRTEVTIQNVNVSTDFCGENGTGVLSNSSKKRKTRKTKDSVGKTVVTSGKEGLGEPEPNIIVQPFEANYSEQPGNQAKNKEESTLSQRNEKAGSKMNTENTFLAKKDEDLTEIEVKNMQQASKHQGKAENVENQVKKESKRKRKSSEKNLPNMQLEDQMSTQRPDAKVNNQIKSSEVGNQDNLEKPLPEVVATSGAPAAMMSRAKRAAYILNFKEDNKNDGHLDGNSSNLQSSLKSNDKQETEDKGPARNASTISPQGSISNDKPDESIVQPVKKQSKASRNGTKAPVSNMSDKVNLIPKETRSHNVADAVHLEKNTNSVSVTVSKATSQRSRIMTKQNIQGNKQWTGVDSNHAANGKKYNGEILNSSELKKKLIGTPGSIFKDDDDDDDGSSEDEEVVGSDSSTRSPSDHLTSDSDYSDGESNANMKTPRNGSYNSAKSEGRNIKNSHLSSAKNMALDQILRSSSRYKIAKQTAAQLHLEEESQQVEVVPDSQANQ
ncbi:uncharacterized protein LOC133822265 [Humulus lupulus]|uniref:uncharacterized protein LOC133822265 n=1 Tax=Humulus lupulus TaxID=3486 RepID=UPI002B408783|nr:uncharacterized protein LOC133822265 [Humulus lupulus]